MCSGCSGYFEDGEENELGDSPGEDNARAWGASSPLQRPSGERTEMIEERPEDAYDVFVSADRIVERRTIGLGCCTGMQKLGLVRAEENATRAIEHSCFLMGKDYQTQSWSHAEDRRRYRVACMYLIYWFLAIGAAAGLVYWVPVL